MSPAPARGWSAGAGATTLVLVRHGVTVHTVDKRFSGGLGGADPALSELGRAQAAATAAWLAPLAPDLSGVVTSPVRRARETAEVLASTWGRDASGLVVEDAVAETDFGAWDGLSFAEVRERHGADLDTWLGSVEARPGGTGESFRAVEARVRAGLARILTAHRGGTAVVVSHVTPIKLLVAEALGAPLDAVHRMELSPASATAISWYADPDGGPDRASLRWFNATPPDAGPPAL